MNQSNATSFNCTVFGIPTPSVSWFRIYQDTRTIIPPAGSGPVISTVINGYNVSSVLLFNNSLATDEGNYACVASNGVVNVIGTPETAGLTLYVQGAYNYVYVHV